MNDLTGVADPPYRGQDRRQRRSATERGRSGERSPLALAACAVVGVAVAFFAGPLLLPSSVAEAGMDLAPLLNAAAVAVALIIGVLCFVRWRLLGQVCSLWLAGALLVYGLATLAVGHLVPEVVRIGDSPVLLWLPPASRIVFIALMVSAVLSPEVDAEVRPVGVVWKAIAGITALTVTFQLLPGLGLALTATHDSVAESHVAPLGSVVLLGTFVLLGGLYLWRGAKIPRPIFSWFGILILALALAEAQRLAFSVDMGVWEAGGSALRLTGLLVAVTGATRDLVSAFGEQGGRLLESVATGATAEARIRAEQAANEERAHEARNALTAIEGATRTLEHYRDRLDPETRASLSAAVSGEIARLQSIVSSTRAPGEAEVFSVGRALRHVVTSAQAAGTDLTVRIDAELQALGRGPETAEVVQNLIENARRYAPDSPILLRANHEEGGVAIRVEDRGPGVEESERRIIFTRGARGRASSRTDGSGLGLYVSLKLMHEQSGDLWVEGRPGGGASFALWLPSPGGVDTGHHGEGHVSGEGPSKAHTASDPPPAASSPQRLRAVPDPPQDGRSAEA